jgi:hypothetical protein
VPLNHCFALCGILGSEMEEVLGWAILTWGPSGCCSEMWAVAGVN